MATIFVATQIDEDGNADTIAFAVSHDAAKRAIAGYLVGGETPPTMEELDEATLDGMRYGRGCDEAMALGTTVGFYRVTDGDDPDYLLDFVVVEIQLAE